MEKEWFASMVQYYRCRSASPFRHSSQMWAKERQTCSQASAGIAQQDFSISCLSSLNVTGFLLTKGRVEYPPYSANSTPQGNASGYPKVTWSIWCAGISQLHLKNSCIESCYVIPAETYSEVCHCCSHLWRMNIWEKQNGEQLEHQQYWTMWCKPLLLHMLCRSLNSLI